MDSSGEYEKEKEIFLCPITIHEENKGNNITFEFTYNELFHICKKLNMDSSKLKHLVSIFQTIIYSLQIENQAIPYACQRIGDSYPFIRVPSERLLISHNKKGFNFHYQPFLVSSSLKLPYAPSWSFRLIVRLLPRFLKLELLIPFASIGILFFFHISFNGYYQGYTRAVG